MEASSVVVVLLFVYAIFSSLGEPPGSYSGPSHSASKIRYLPKSETGVVVSDKVLHSFGELPPADYVGDDNGYLEVGVKSFILGYAPKCSAEDARDISNALLKYSKQFNVNTKLLTAIIARESRFNRYAVSSRGAQGLGQLLPSTSRYMGIEDPFDVYQNLKGTAKYVRYLLDKWPGRKAQVPLAIASYLEGPNAIRRKGLYRTHSVAYIKDILRIYKKI